MKKQVSHTIYTIGHSTHTFTAFLTMLQSFDIKVLADIRSLPGSRKYPQFNKENLEMSLPEIGIVYMHLTDLSGRRKVKKSSKNTRWHNASFRGYADYMETKAFEKAIVELEKIAVKKPTAIMCAEAVWWRCHRSMVSDYLKVKDWRVLHIMTVGKLQEHKYTQPTEIIDGTLSYSDET
jgi:uncharacterized protein (DUF488 family)